MLAAVENSGISVTEEKCWTAQLLNSERFVLLSIKLCRNTLQFKLLCRWLKIQDKHKRVVSD